MNKISLSPIIAGTMNWGTWGKNYSTIEMTSMIECCLENDITSFDHADIYGDYTTEASFGKAFKETSVKREDVQFISKCGIQLLGGVRKNTTKYYDYSKQYIINSVENSLKNLHTNYLDVLLLHRPSPLMHADEIAEAINDLKQDGKIISFGVSNFTSSQTALINSKITTDYNQIEFSLTHFEAMQNGNLDYMQCNKITPMCWSPLGTFFKNDSKQNKNLKIVADELAVKYNVPIDVILLTWITKHPANILPVCGTTDATRISHLMKATTLQMELIDWFALLEASMDKEVP